MKTRDCLSSVDAQPETDEVKSWRALSNPKVAKLRYRVAAY